MILTRRYFWSAIAVGMLALAPLLAAAQSNYPSRSIRMVVPFARRRRHRYRGAPAG